MLVVTVWALAATGLFILSVGWATIAHAEADRLRQENAALRIDECYYRRLALNQDATEDDEDFPLPQSYPWREGPDADD